MYYIDARWALFMFNTTQTIGTKQKNDWFFEWSIFTVGPASPLIV